MALDYSKLSEEELEAIANDDYTKLSDKTLNAIANDSSAKVSATPSISVLPQVASVAKEMVGMAPSAMQAGMELGKKGLTNLGNYIGNKSVVQTAADIAGVATHGVPWGTLAKQAIDPNATTVREALGTMGNVAKQGAGMMGQAARNIGGAVVSGAVSPESLFVAPYQMAAYEQEKIRQNPNMPGLEYNPYAQVQRGEARTQGQAASANQMRAVSNMPYGNVSQEERRMLDEDRMMRQAIRKKAFEKVMGPAVPGSF